MIEFIRPRDPLREQTDKLMQRCAPGNMGDLSTADFVKAKETTDILTHIQKSSWIHGWLDEDGRPLKKYVPGQMVWIGGLGDDQMQTPYIQIPLPKTPPEFLTMLEAHLTNGHRDLAPDRTMSRERERA